MRYSYPTILALPPLILFLLSTPTHAAFNFTTQSRAVSAQSTGIYGADFKNGSSAAGGFYQATAAANDGQGGFSTQTIKSDLQPNLIYVMGGWTGMYQLGMGMGKVDGKADATINFNVTQNTDVQMTLTSILNEPDGPSTFSNPPRSIKLTGPGMNVNWTLRYPPPTLAGSGPLNFSQSGTLTPGAYTLSLSLGSYFYDRFPTQPAIKGQIASFDLELSPVPEPSTASALIFPALAIAQRRARRH